MYGVNDRAMNHLYVSAVPSSFIDLYEIYLEQKFRVIKAADLIITLSKIPASILAIYF